MWGSVYWYRCVDPTTIWEFGEMGRWILDARACDCECTCLLMCTGEGVNATTSPTVIMLIF